MTIAVKELGYLGFEVVDLTKWEQFASNVLGLEVRTGEVSANAGAVRLLRMDEQGHRFILSEGASDDYAYAGWRVEDAAAVEASRAHLDALGIAWTAGTDNELAVRGAQRMIHFNDPAGNRHEVYCSQTVAPSPFKSALVPSGFVTDAGGLGHVVFEADEYTQMVEFAQKVLGMRLSDHIDLEVGPGTSVEVAFFHTNQRHHSFAVAPRAPNAGPRKRIHHFMLEARSMSDVGYTRDRFLAVGLPVIMDIGQHPNDQMISFYGQTPSGFNVEFGYGGVLVDEAAWKSCRYDHMSSWGHRPAPLLPQGNAQHNGTKGEQ